MEHFKFPAPKNNIPTDEKDSFPGNEHKEPAIGRQYLTYLFM
jgi:hypothetical protein